MLIILPNLKHSFISPVPVPDPVPLPDPDFLPYALRDCFTRYTNLQLIAKCDQILCETSCE